MKYFAKFKENGERESSLAENANFTITPPQPILEYEKGKEIIITIPAFEGFDENGETVYHDEEKLSTGKYEKTGRIVGYTDETIEPPIPADYIEITEEEQVLYCNGYIRDPITGKPVPAPPYIPTESDMRAAKLAQINEWTEKAITSGFMSNAKGSHHTYDSTKEDQMNLDAMYNASRSVNFATDPMYKGQIPLRCIPEGETGKIILHHNAAEMQQIIDDKARHIGLCKQRGWELQAQAGAAKTEDDFGGIIW